MCVCVCVLMRELIVIILGHFNSSSTCYLLLSLHNSYHSNEIQLFNESFRVLADEDLRLE